MVGYASEFGRCTVGRNSDRAERSRLNYARSAPLFFQSLWEVVMANVNRAWGEGGNVGPAGRRKEVAHERDASQEQPKSRSTHQQKETLRNCIDDFTADDMGYLKIRRGLDSQDVHLTWQFSNGKFYGHYVYVRVEWWQIDYGLELLIQKRDEVYQGTRRPTPDKRSAHTDTPS